MTTKSEHIFEGLVSYAFVHKLNKYNKYALNFYPKSTEDRKAIVATGTRCKPKLDDDGGIFFTFTTDENPKEVLPVAMGDGSSVTAIIGNGSTAKVKIEVEKFTSAKYGEVSRTRLLGVVITDLIPYEKKEDASANPSEGRDKTSTDERPVKMPF